jgi:predicted nuclease of predicted toxin-antitoxin system
MKLLLDMNLSPLLAMEMTSAGYETVHWSAVGAFNASDPELMAYAVHHGYVVVTHDLDFGAILAASGTKAPSVVQIRADNLEVKAISRLLVIALKQSKQALEQGALLILDTLRSRVRVLPLVRS